MSPECQIDVRFFPPKAELRRYFTTFYHVDWTVADGETTSDHLLPEWANLRFHTGSLPAAQTLSGASVGGTAFPVTGPSSKALRFTVGSTRMWGIGLLPLGWAKFVGPPAADFADVLLDGLVHPDFADFRDLAGTLFGDAPDIDAELSRITAHFLARIDRSVPEEGRIVAVHTALVDPDTASVAQLVERAGIGQRSVERICHRAFGFPPKLLLRRQRFMRSLSKFMLDPSLRWVGAMDRHYHDQAQFVRDCRQFMGMTPRQFGALPKPLIGAVMRERTRMAGEAVQTLDSPDGLIRPG